MDTNEIMVNEEVMDVTEEIATASSGKGLKVVVGIGLAVLACGVAYKYVIKPMVAKIKTKKEQQEINDDNIKYYSESDEVEKFDEVS